MTNKTNARYEKGATKKEIALQTNLFIQTVSRHYDLTDDQEVFFELKHCPSRPFYCIDTNRVVIGPKDMDTWTVAHELAHWVQQMIEGETWCRSATRTQQREKGAFIHRHDIITAQIKTLAKESGYRLWLQLNA